MFFIKHTDIGEQSAAIIEIDGHLSSDSAPDFDDYINKLLDNNIIYLLIDMKNLNFISSIGIGAILMLQKFTNEKNGLTVFFNLNYEITSLLKLLGFDLLFNIVSDRSEALHILDRHMELFPKEPVPQIFEKDNTQDEPISEESLKNKSTSVDLLSIIETPEHQTSVDITEVKNNDALFEAFIIECIKCKSLIRIKEPGDQLCPYCNSEFSVTDKNKALFKIKEIR